MSISTNENSELQDKPGLVTDLVPLLFAYVDTDLRYRFHNKAYAYWFGHGAAEINGKHVSEVVSPAVYQSILPHLETALAGQALSFDMAMPSEQGERRSIHTELIPDVGPDGLVRGLVGYVRDITERRLIEEKLQTVAGRQMVLIAAQSEITEAGRDLGAALDCVTLRARQITGASGAVVQLIEGKELIYHAASGTAEALLGLRILIEDSFSGQCVREGRALYCPDVYLEPDMNQDILRGRQIRSMVVVPLPHMGRVIGVLQVSSVQPNAFDEDAVTLLQLMVSMIIAAMSGVAEAEARLALSAGEARQRKFLRDVLLSVTDGCLHLCDGPDDLPSPRALFGELVTVSRSGSLADLRRLVWEASEAAGLPPDRAHDLLTAVGEASMNAVVHAGEGIAQISLMDGIVQVRIEDQGEGITVENLPKATLAWGFSTKATLGHGFKMMLQTVDRIFLLTGSGGTTVVLEQDRCTSLPDW